MRARGTEKLKDDRSEGINVNLMHSDTLMFNFFEKFLQIAQEIDQRGIMRKI